MELVRYDANGPELANDVASFEILNPDLPPVTKNTYCIGFKYLGGDPLNPNNWRYNHTTYHDEENIQHTHGISSIMVPKEILDNILRKHSVRLEDLLSDYLGRVYGSR